MLVQADFQKFRPRQSPVVYYQRSLCALLPVEFNQQRLHHPGNIKIRVVERNFDLRHRNLQKSRFQTSNSTSFWLAKKDTSARTFNLHRIVMKSALLGQRQIEPGLDRVDVAGNYFIHIGVRGRQERVPDLRKGQVEFILDQTPPANAWE